MIGEKMNRKGKRNGRIFRESRKSRNGLRPRPDVPDIPGHAAESGRKSRNGLRPRPDMPDIPGAMRRRGKEERTDNYK